MTKETQEITSYCLKKAKAAGAVYAEIIMVDSSMVMARSRLQKTETVESAESSDLGLRVFLGKEGKLKQALVSTSDTSKKTLDQVAVRAVEMAKVATSDPFLTIPSLGKNSGSPTNINIYDSKTPKAEKLMEYCQKAEEEALKTKGVTNSEGAETSYSQKKLTLTNSSGFFDSYKSSYCSMSLSVIAGKGMDMQTDYDYAVARHFADLKAPKDLGKLAAERAIRKLNPRKVKTCQVPIIFEARIAREIIDMVTSGVNGAAVARKTSFLKDKMGKRIFKKGINIIDDPFIKKGISSRPFDGEGIAGKKLNLVNDGILDSWLLDIKSAKQLKLKTNARASRGISSPPHPTHTNVYMENGKTSLKEMIAGIKKGFYVTEAFGMGINMVTGDYSQGASGVWIENGKLTHAVSEVTIAGNIPDMFINLTPADDLEFIYGINSPSLMIEGMTIAGA